MVDLSYIYQARSPSPKKPKKKRTNYLYFWGSVVGGLIVLGGVVSYLVFYRSGSVEIVPENPEKECAQILNRSQDGQLVISICVKKNGSLVLLWENLPDDARKIDIFRAAPNGTSELWRTVNVGSLSGSAELGLESDARGYNYSFTANSASGGIIWNSTQATSQSGDRVYSSLAGTSSGGQTSTAPTSGPPAGGAPQGTPGQTTVPPPPQSTSTGSQTQGGTPGTTGATSSPTQTPPPGQIYYYTPSGQVSGTSTLEASHFWVRHVNKKIEVGWQNLPTSTTKIVVLRSASENTGYSNLFIQNAPNLISDFIRLDDHTISSPYYYKMTVYAGSSIIQTYGPVLLPGL